MNDHDWKKEIRDLEDDYLDSQVSAFRLGFFVGMFAGMVVAFGLVFATRIVKLFVEG